jgi:hypothetical protein
MANPIARVKREYPRVWEAVLLVTESLPLVAGIGAFTWARNIGPDRASEAFYTAAAGVIPVLLLTLAIQVRAFSLRRGPRSGRTDEEYDLLSFQLAFRAIRRFYELVFLVMLVLAELATLRTLAEERYTEFDARDIFAAIAFGLVMLAAIALVEPNQHESREE